MSRLVHVCMVMGIILILYTDDAYMDIRKDFAKCAIPGIDKFFPIMRFNPCFKCLCEKRAENEVCRIKKQHCPKLPCTVHEVNPEKCCRKCKPCTHNGRTYENEQVWYNGDNNCTKLTCKEGVVSDITPECLATCRNPVTIKGQCCPVCQDCVNDQHIIKKRKIELDDPCVKCKCINKSLTCYKEKCPILVCKNPVQKPGLCCPVCEQDKEVKQLSPDERMCVFRGKQLEHLESLLLDKCTICDCINGTVICKNEKCPLKSDCPSEELVSVRGHCCPMCAKQLTCNFMGRIYKNLEVWYLKGCVVCQCVNGRNMCKRQICQKKTECKPGFEATYRVGSCCLECLPERKTCIGYGDPHYRTFDGNAYSYQGICKYTLTKDFSRNQLFTVISRNSGRYTNGFSWIKTLTFHYANLTITLAQNHKVKINGKTIKTPFLYYPFIDIKLSKRYVYVYTKDEIRIKWDGDSYVEISLPRKFMNQVNGLCGNFNANPYDDFIISNKTLTVNEFGDFWRLKESKICKRHTRFFNNPQLAACTGWRLFRAHRICRKSFSDRTIQGCKRNIHTSVYFEDCLTDVCQCNFGRRNCECGAVRSYYNRCSSFIKNLKWKKKESCDLSCTGGSIYSSCGPSCHQSCKTINNIEPCTQSNKCVAGCFCPAGFVWHQGKCIPPFQCPFLR